MSQCLDFPWKTVVVSCPVDLLTRLPTEVLKPTRMMNRTVSTKNNSRKARILFVGSKRRKPSRQQKRQDVDADSGDVFRLVRNECMRVNE